MKFKETGPVCDTPKSGRPSLEQEKVDIIAGLYVQKPCSNEAGCFYETVNNVVLSKLDLFPY